MGARLGAYVWRAEDSSVPVGHEQIITFGQTVGACLCDVVSSCSFLNW